MPDPKPPLPRPDDWRQHDAALQAALQDGQAARWQALAQYLHALPLATANHWELFRCMLLDLAALRDQATDKDAP